MQAVVTAHVVVLRLALVKRIILDECLLKKAAKAHALLSVCLHLVIVLTMLAHFDVLLEVFDLSLFHLVLKLHLSILPFQLLDQKALQIVRLLTHRCHSPSMHEVGLVLQLSRQCLNVFLLLLEIDIHLLGLGAQTSVFIPCDVVLDLQVAIHIANLLLLSLAENWGLVGLKAVGGERVVRVVSIASVVVNFTACTLNLWLLRSHW